MGVAPYRVAAEMPAEAPPVVEPAPRALVDVDVGAPAMVVRIEEAHDADDTPAVVVLGTWLVTFAIAAAMIVASLIARSC